MSRKRRQLRNRKGLKIATFVKWYANAFSIGFGPPHGETQTWTGEEAKEFYKKNKEAIDRAVQEKGSGEEALQEWEQQGFKLEK